MLETAFLVGFTETIKAAGFLHGFVEACSESEFPPSVVSAAVVSDTVVPASEEESSRPTCGREIAPSGVYLLTIRNNSPPPLQVVTNAA